MLPTLNYDAILSDPLLLLAGVFLIAGPLVFLVALVKFLSWGRKQKQADTYSDLNPFAPTPVSETPVTPLPSSSYENPQPEYTPVSEAPVQSEQALPPVQTPEPEPAIPQELPAVRAPFQESISDKTVIMPAGMGEVQGQLEIAFSQIKNLGKKVAQMESELESVARNISGKLDPNELKEVPMNPADFTQKLLKLAEHVIVLEKEVERLKSPGGKKEATRTQETLPPTPKIPQIPSAPKPPMMPL